MKHLVIKFWLIYILGFAVISASALMAHEILGKNFSNSGSIFTRSFTNLLVVKEF
uniref:hypothetical protein n=1 Tax=Aliarcobacter sp. TaxID=2321116 RepID=UPI0040480F18